MELCICINIKDDNIRDTAFAEYFDNILSSTKNLDVKIKTLKTCGKAFIFKNIGTEHHIIGTWHPKKSKMKKEYTCQSM